MQSCSSGRKAQDAGPGFHERGIASWYGPGFHGKRTANGEVYDMDTMTAAHKQLPFDSIVEVRNLDNGKKTQVRINDRGPFVRGRIIDLSRAAAKDIGMLGPGTAKVEIRVLKSKAIQETKKRYLVQAGAFRDRENARDLQRRLEKTFGDVRIQSEDNLYRVLLGPYKKRKEAERIRRELTDLGVTGLVRTIA